MKSTKDQTINGGKMNIGKGREKILRRGAATRSKEVRPYGNEGKKV